MADFIDSLNKALRYGAGNTHTEFTDRMAVDGKDRTTPLVYADWLEEQGHAGVADHIRKSVDDHVANDPSSNHYVATTLSPVGDYAVPPKHPDGAPSLYLTTPWKGPDGNPFVGVGTIHRKGKTPNTGRSRLKAYQRDGNAYSIRLGRSVPVSEAFRIVRSMPEIPNADKALQYLTQNYPHLDPDKS